MAYPILSVIIPAYNAARTIKRTISSLVDESVGSSLYEIIIINDGSSDDTSIELEELCLRYSMVNIFIFHSENYGVCHARNLGLSQAKGTYITFVDSDDYVDPKMISTIISIVEDNPTVDLWKYGVIEHYSTCGKAIYDKVNSVSTDILMSIDRMISSLLQLESMPLFGYVCNSIFKRQIIESHKLYFDSQYIMEDFIFTFSYFKVSSSMGMIPKIYYHYILDLESQSLSKKWEPTYYDMYRNKIGLIYTYMQTQGINDIKMYKQLARLYVRYIYSALERMYRYHESIDTCKMWLQELYKDDIYIIMCPYMVLPISILGILARLLQQKRTWLIMIVVRVIFFVRVYCKKIFVILKSRQ